MAKYTIEVRKIIDLMGRDTVESWFKDYNINEYLTPEQIDVIENTNVWSKERLARKIVDHYFMREIAQETIALWKHYVKVEMQELMEEYLPLIYSSAIQYDPLINVNFTETFERTANTDNQGNANSSGLGVASDTPQGRITKSSILAGNYASSTSASENETSSTSSSDEKESYVKTTRGNSGVSATSQKMIEQYRDNIRAIDKEIINKLETLFMGLY